MKKIIGVAIAVLIALGSASTSNEQNHFYFSTIRKSRTSEFNGHCSAYGFSISNDWEPIYMKDFQTYSYPVNDAGELQYQTDIQQVFLKNVNSSNTYAFAYRVVLSPLQPGRDWGFIGIGSHGDNWYARVLKTTIDLRDGYSLADWSPKNLPANYSGTIGVCGGSSGFEISATVDFSMSELTVTSRSNVATSHYETEYSIYGYGNYAANSVVFYGFLTFIVPNSYSAWIDVTHTCEYFGSEYHGTVSHNYSFTY
ncbi:MAG: hypothetical protein PUC70_00955 [bacterium]|nr:hypothetical protein [bacterium]